MQPLADGALLVCTFFANQHADHPIAVFNRLDRLNDVCPLLRDGFHLLCCNAKLERPRNRRFIFRLCQQTNHRFLIRRRHTLRLCLRNDNRIALRSRTIDKDICIFQICKRLKHHAHPFDDADFFFGKVCILFA